MNSSSNTKSGIQVEMVAVHQPVETNEAEVGSETIMFPGMISDNRSDIISAGERAFSISSAGFQGMVADINEMDHSDDTQWIGVGRFSSGIENGIIEGTKEEKTTGLIAVSVSSFHQLRDALDTGVVLLDAEADSLQEVVDLVLNEAELRNLIQATMRETIQKLFSINSTSAPLDTKHQSKEMCKVYVTKVDTLSQPLVALIRLKKPISVDKSSAARYFLFVLGDVHSRYSDLHEIGRAFCMMMSQNWFSSAARKIQSPPLYIKLMDNFLTRCMMLPPPNPHSVDPFRLQTKVKSVNMCCAGRSEQATTYVMMPSNTMERTYRQLQHREKVLQEREATLMSEAMQLEPSTDDLMNNTAQRFISHLTSRDKIDDGKHITTMMGSASTIPGGFHSISVDYPLSITLNSSPRGLYEVRTALQMKSLSTYTLHFLLEEVVDGTPVVLTAYNVTSDLKDEVEDRENIDVKRQLKSDSSNIVMTVTTESVTPVAFMMFVEPMNIIGRYRILLGSIILVATYIILMLEIINRAVVAFIGAFLTLLLMSFTSSAPSLDDVVTWLDSSTLCLLFGMMIMVQMLSTTGLFEYLAVTVITISKGHILIINFALCILTVVCSAFLDNVTTMLLIAPVTIELSRMMGMSPIPFLLPEVIFSNIGGTATLIGDPPNIIIGNMLKEHVSFMDFIYNTMPCVLICIPFVYVFVYVYYRKDLSKPRFEVDKSLKEKYQIKNKPLLAKCGIVLLTVIILLFLHSFHHVDPAYLALAGAFTCLFLGTNEDLHTTFELLEWETLVFFAGLFIMIEGINQLGVIRAIGDAAAALIVKAKPSQQSLLAHMIILWISGIASSVLDNIALTATMIPILQILAGNPALSLDIVTLAWALSFGACFGGNGTLVGAGANLVTAGICSSSGHPITFGQFFKFGSLAMLITMIISTVYVLVRYV